MNVLHRPSRRLLAVSAAVAVVASGLVTYTAISADADEPKACWIEASGETFLPDAPPGASTPQLALLRHQTAVNRVLTESVSATGQLRSGAQLGPGGLPFLRAQLDGLKSARLVGNDDQAAKFNAVNRAGQSVATFQVERSYQDKTWWVTGWAVQLPVGTDCSVDQLGNA